MLHSQLEALSSASFLSLSVTDNFLINQTQKLLSLSPQSESARKFPTSSSSVTRQKFRDMLKRGIRINCLGVDGAENKNGDSLCKGTRLPRTRLVLRLLRGRDIPNQLENGQ